MTTINTSVSVCSHCRNYQYPRGCGGYCNQLGVEVKGKWKACPLAIPVFLSAAEKEDIVAEVTGNVSPVHSRIGGIC